MMEMTADPATSEPSSMPKAQEQYPAITKMERTEMTI